MLVAPHREPDEPLPEPDLHPRAAHRIEPRGDDLAAQMRRHLPQVRAQREGRVLAPLPGGNPSLARVVEVHADGQRFVQLEHALQVQHTGIE